MVTSARRVPNPCNAPQNLAITSNYAGADRGRRGADRSHAADRIQQPTAAHLRNRMQQARELPTPGTAKNERRKERRECRISPGEETEGGVSPPSVVHDAVD